MAKKRRPGRPTRDRHGGQLVHVWLNRALYRALKARAAADDRSFTATVERMLTAALQQKGESQ